jgi:uncharacterized protein YybS (DUF2232 family)
MPENRILYLGIVLIIAAVSVWIGAELTRRVEWAVPYIGGAGVILIVVGVVLEIWKVRQKKAG